QLASLGAQDLGVQARGTARRTQLLPAAQVAETEQQPAPLAQVVRRLEQEAAVRLVAGIEERVMQVAGVDEVFWRLDEVGVPVDEVEPLVCGQRTKQVAVADVHPVGYPVPLNVAPRVLYRSRTDVQGRHPA